MVQVTAGGGRGRRAARWRAPRVFGLAMVLAVGLPLAGCATDGAQGLRNPFANLNLSNPFRRGTEADFQALVRQQCGTLAVGNSTVGALLAGDPVFQDQASQLYRGDLSNDEFLNAVLAAHPAADANVPAVGCMVTALQTCMTGPCQPTASQAGPAGDTAALSAAPAGEPLPETVPVAAPAMPELMPSPVPERPPAPAPTPPPAGAVATPLPWRG